MTRETARSSVTELFHSWYVPLLRHAVRIVGAIQVAEDLVQETFVAYYNELRVGHTVHNPQAWSLVVLRRGALRWIKSQKSQVTLDQVPPAAISVRPFLSASADALKQVESLLPNLSGREEEVVLLRLAGMKYREIAAELEISQKTVTTLLSRALKKLQQAHSERQMKRFTKDNDPLERRRTS